MRWLSAMALSGLLMALPALAQSTAQDEAGAQRQERAQDETKPVGTAGAETATVNDIVDNSSNWYDKEVVVEGPIGDLFSQRVFNIEEDGVVDVDDELLVLLTSKTKTSGTLTEDSEVQVRGTIVSFVQSDIERTYGITDWGWYTVQPTFWVEYDRRPVLIATSIDIVP
jgi:uncharacterized protein YdeI (BOF family)